ncbi:MAG: IS1 family transposase [Bacteroidota bacterium]
MRTQSCPHCHSTKVVKNGLTYYGKQNHRCKNCKRQFVQRAASDPLDLEQTVKRLLLERISLRGICRVVGKKMGWLMHFLEKLYAQLPPALPMVLIEEPEVSLWKVEADEMWSFVHNKGNKQWIWLAMERNTRQIVGFWVGPRSEEGAWGLWYSIPEKIRNQAHFHTDDWDAYGKVLPPKRHTISSVKAKTNHIERFNNTLRHRCSRLVRKNLAFSKKLENHIDAIAFFISF